MRYSSEIIVFRRANGGMRALNQGLDSVWPIQPVLAKVDGDEECVVAEAFDDMGSILDQLLALLVLILDRFQGAELDVDTVSP